jgi:pimeloyl-ACP methyl ester carboxylesterase
MGNFGKKIIALAAAGVVAASGLGADSGIALAAEGSDTGNGKVYMLVGGAIGIFSRGLNRLSDQLNGLGIRSEVLGTGAWRRIAAELVEKHSAGRTVAPLVIVGHSWGATAALLMAEELGDHSVPVDLVVTFDPVDAVKLGPNVDRIINFYVKNGGVSVPVRSDFTGSLENFNVLELNEGIWHFNIDENKTLHRRVIEATRQEFEN